MAGFRDASSYHSLLAHDLEVWQKDLAALDVQLAKLTAERDNLRQRIVAAATLLNKPLNHDFTRAPERERSIIHDIADLMSDGMARSPHDIRQALIGRGIAPERVSSTTPQFYNAIARLVGKGSLTRDAAGNYRQGGR